jgi:teichuronic acid biosynthesis glycosyltransferase TuaC
MRVLAVTNIYPTPSNPALGTFVEQQVEGLRTAGLEVEVLFVDRRQEGARAYLGLGDQIRSSLRRFNADIVHVMYGGVMAELATRTIRDRPTVVTFHGADLLGEHVSGYLRRLSARFGVLSSRRAARRATGIVVVARLLGEMLPRKVDQARVRIIPCGIDLTRFRPLEPSLCRQQLGWRDRGFHVLFNSNGDDPVKQPGLARATVQAARLAGIPAELHELRGVCNSQVPVWLNASHVLLLTSCHEGSPTIVKEALACNLPVVSVDVGDVREQMHGIEGCYLASPTPGDLASKLRLVFAAYRRVDARSKMEELSVGCVALRLKRFYEELLSQYNTTVSPRAL